MAWENWSNDGHPFGERHIASFGTWSLSARYEGHPHGLNWVWESWEGGEPYGRGRAVSLEDARLSAVRSMRWAAL